MLPEVAVVAEPAWEPAVAQVRVAALGRAAAAATGKRRRRMTLPLIQTEQRRQVLAGADQVGQGVTIENVVKGGKSLL